MRTTSRKSISSERHGLKPGDPDLRHVALWHCGMALWHCVTVALWHCGTNTFWFYLLKHSGILTHCTHCMLYYNDIIKRGTKEEVLVLFTVIMVSSSKEKGIVIYSMVPDIWTFALFCNAFFFSKKPLMNFFLRLRWRVYVYVCMYGCVCVYVCVSVCGWVYVCVGVRVYVNSLPWARGGSGWDFFSNFRNTQFFFKINLYDDVLAKKILILDKIHQAPHGFIRRGKMDRRSKFQKGPTSPLSLLL